MYKSIVSGRQYINYTTDKTITMRISDANAAFTDIEFNLDQVYTDDEILAEIDGAIVD